MDEAEINPENWVRDHGDYLFRYAYVRLNNRSAAEDVVQETFLAAIKARDRFDGRGRVRYWLLGILKHKVVDHIRKASREVPVEDPEMVETTNSATFRYLGLPTREAPAWQFNPRKAFEQREFWNVFSKCLTGLKGNTQKAFAMRELEGMATEEICKVLGVTANNLWVILHRARGQLKTCLEEHWLRKHAEERSSHVDV